MQKITRENKRREIEKTILETQGAGALRIFRMKNNKKFKKDK